MYSFLSKINPLYTGIFLLTWSMNSFFMFGLIGRSFFQYAGFILIIFAAYLSPNKKGALRFFYRALFFYLIYILISIAQDQETLSNTNIIFGLVCFSLLICGFILAKNHHIFQKISSNIIIFYCILIYLGAFFFQDYLILNSASTRSFELDLSINTIGMAYTNGILFFLLLSILYSKINIKLITKIFLIGAIMITLISIITTQSRGAIIYITLILIIIYLKQIINLKKIIYYLFTLFFLGLAFYFFILFLTEASPIFESRIEGFINRFESLISYTQNEHTDLSGDARKVKYIDFLDNFNSFILLGKYNYLPYPHHQYMEILMRWGLMGLPILFLSIFTFFKSLKLANVENFKIAPIPLTITLIFLFSYLQSFTSLSLEMNRLLWFGFGFLISFKK